MTRRAGPRGSAGVASLHSSQLFIILNIPQQGRPASRCDPHAITQGPGLTRASAVDTGKFFQVSYTGASVFVLHGPATDGAAGLPCGVLPEFTPVNWPCEEAAV